jgi:hypothetical protein
MTGTAMKPIRHRLQVQDLKPGDKFDAERIVELLYEHDLCGADEYDRVLHELAVVESVELEQPADMGTYHDNMAYGSAMLAVVYTDQGNWAVPAGLEVYRVI